MSNRLIRPVPSRTAADSSSCGSRRVRPARTAVSKRSSQIRTANCTLLYGLSRGTYINVVYPIMLDTACRSKTLHDTADCSKTSQAAPLHNQVHIINIHETSTMQILQNLLYIMLIFSIKSAYRTWDDYIYIYIYMES